MISGTPVGREFIFVLSDGAFVVDWGDHSVQDVFSGEFLRYEDKDFGHPITDVELDWLVKRGRVGGFDSRTVYLLALPEGQRKALD